MNDRIIQQAYQELACLRDRLENAEERQLRLDELRFRIALSEARVRRLEWVAFYAVKT